MEIYHFGIKGKMIFVKRSCFSQCSILKTELYYFLIILSYRLDNYPLDMWISLLINSLEAVVIDTRLYCINIDQLSLFRE